VDSGLRIVDRKGRTAKWLAIVPAMFALVAIAVPWLMVRTPEIAFALQRGFAMVCHQQSDRSFVLFGGTIAVCARCLGIYLGGTPGLLVQLPRGVAMRFLIVAVALNSVDWLAEFAGLHGNWMFVRFALGVGLGAAGAMVVSASIPESPAAKASRRSTPARHVRT
jgi:uncharacterized membrane protein